MPIEEEIFAALDAHERTFAAACDLGARPRAPTSHVVYGGAHLFREGTIEKVGRLAQASFEANAPDAATLARAIGIDEAIAPVVFDRVARKLASRPVEDYRIDFEDGYGVRSDEEEDAHAVGAARALATRVGTGPLGSAIGIRIKALAPASRARAARTLRLFVETFASASSPTLLPHDFVVTLPKVRAPFEVEALVRLLGDLERRVGLSAGAIGIELMIETPESLVDARGALAMPSLIRATDARCTALHLGSYDLTSAFGVPAHAQRLDHPLCDFAKALMKTSLTGSGSVLFPHLSDGATTILPVGDRDAVHAAWRLHADGVRHGLTAGFFQGWDLHPAQLPARFAALFAFFLGALPAMRERLAAFRAESERATRLGQAFDDRATALALETFFHRGRVCGALHERDVDEGLAT